MESYEQIHETAENLKDLDRREEQIVRILEGLSEYDRELVLTNVRNRALTRAIGVEEDETKEA